MRRAVHAINLLRFAAGAHHPIIGPAKVAWDVTHRCNLRCKHCHLWQVKEHNDLTTDEAKRFISDLRRIGTLHLSFSGGEPFLRKDMHELMTYAREQGLTTAANTNGTLFGTPESARRACQTGLGTFFISLDGPDAETHNALRGSSRAFDTTLRGIDNLIEQRESPRQLVFINTTVTAGNIDNLERIVELAHKHGVDGMTMSVIQNIDKYEPESDAEIAEETASGLADHLLKLAANSGGLIPHSTDYIRHFQTYLEHPNDLYQYRCAAGYSIAMVHPGGEVYPCPVPFTQIGSIREKPFSDIWYSEEADRVRKLIKANKHPICWFDCIAPLNVLVHGIRSFRLGQVFHKKTLVHIIRKSSR